LVRAPSVGSGDYGVGGRHRGELPHGAAVFILPAARFLPPNAPPHAVYPPRRNRKWINIRSGSWRVPDGRSAVKSRLYWIVVGGLSFWFPAIVLNAALDQRSSLWTLNVVPLAGVTLLGAASWITTKHLPKWAWVLAGVYIIGPVSMLSPLAFARIPSSPAEFGGYFIVVLLCLFPPTTLWFSLLNGMLFSVLIATLILPFLAAYLKGPGLRPGSPVL